MSDSKPSAPVSELACRLRQGRHAANLSIRGAGAALGVSPQTVFYWEHDTHEPNSAALRRICEAYGVSADWLLFGTDPVCREVGTALQEVESVVDAVDREPADLRLPA